MICVDGMMTESGRMTTLKRRFATKSQQLLRVDMETTAAICDESKQAVIDYIRERIGPIEAFAGASFVKPNNLELEQASGVVITDDASLDEAGKTYLDRSGADALLVTCGAMGISVYEPLKARRDYPSKAAQVFDVTGAGDTVISMATMALAAGIPLSDAVALGNLAAGIVISKTGTVPITIGELEKAVGENDETFVR